MANKKIKGITVEIGGDTSKLGDALKQSESQANSLYGELREVNKMLKFDPSNVELLSQKQKLLTNEIETTSEKLRILKEAEEQVVAQFERDEIGEDQLRAFQREIIKTKSQLDGMESALKDTSDGLENVGESADNSSEGFTVMKGALAGLVADVITSAISAIGDLIGSLFDLSEATEEYRQMQAKLAGASETFGYSMDFVNGKYEEFYKYVGDDQMATNAITNLTGIGTSTESVSKLAEGATAVWASYGDSIPIEPLTESINETVTVGKVTGTMADTINWAKDANENLGKALSGNKEAQKAYNDAIKEGLPVEDAFNEALAKVTDEQERADIVAKFLNETYGESKKSYDEMSGSILDANEAELALKETQAELGETMTPVNTAMTNLKNQALEAIVPLVEKLADGFLNLLTWLREHPVALQIITGVVIGLATAFGVLATALAIQGLIAGVTKAIAFLNATILANPIVLIIALIAGLVASFLYLWKNCDSFRAFFVKMWEKIKSTTDKVLTALKKWFTKTLPNALKVLLDWFKSLPSKAYNAIAGLVGKVASWGSKLVSTAKDKVSSFVSNIVSKAKEVPSKVYNAIQGAISRVGSWGSQMVSKAKTAMGNVVSGIKSKLQTAVSTVKSIGRNIVEGLWNGISNKVGWIKSKLSGFKDSVMKALKSFFKIKSPSQLMRDEVGRYISEGIAEGITPKESVKAVNKVGEEILRSAEDINGATLNRRIENTFTGSVNADNKNVLNRLDNILKQLEAKTQIVLDTGVLVGETIDAIDAGLASNQMLRVRGV